MAERAPRPERPWRVTEAGLRLFVRLTPGSDRDAVGGIQGRDDGRISLSARVRARPEKGAANKALEKLLARGAGVAKSQVVVVAGRSAREKIVEISGEGSELADTFERLVGAVG